MLLGKKQINIGEYNFSQATLEQVFLGFAKFQMSDSNTITEQHNRSLDLANARKVSDQSKLHKSRSSTCNMG